MEKKTSQDRRRVHYEVQTRRDTKLIKRFINFKNRVEHPTVTPGLILIGITFILLPFVRPEIKKDIRNLRGCCQRPYWGISDVFGNRKTIYNDSFDEEKSGYCFK